MVVNRFGCYGDRGVCQVFPPRHTAWVSYCVGLESCGYPSKNVRAVSQALLQCLHQPLLADVFHVIPHLLFP